MWEEGLLRRTPPPSPSFFCLLSPPPSLPPLPSLTVRKREILATIHYSENKRIKNMMSLQKSVRPRAPAHSAALPSAWHTDLRFGGLCETLRALEKQVADFEAAWNWDVT